MKHKLTPIEFRDRLLRSSRWSHHDKMRLERMPVRHAITYMMLEMHADDAAWQAVVAEAAQEPSRAEIEDDRARQMQTEGMHLRAFAEEI